MFSGRVQSGNITNITYLSGYDILLYNNDILISQTVSDQNGNFTFNVSDHCGIFYVIAYSNNIKLFCIIGDNLNVKNIIINELTTISCLYCFNNMIHNGIITGNGKSLKTASLMNFNFVNYTGTLSDVIQTSPNGNETNALQLLNSLSNLLAICINNQEIYNNVVIYTTVKNITPQNTAEIITSIVRNPANNISVIFSSTLIYKIYAPYLPFDNVPGAFTLAVKVNNSGNMNYLIGGIGNIVFDDNGNAWCTNNVIQGTPDSSNFTVVLQPNGKPTSFSPVIGGGNVGCGFGIVKYFDNIIVGNYGWGNVFPAGGLTIYKEDGTVLTGENGFQDSLYRVQGMSVDNKNNIWVCSYGNSCVVCYINGDLNNKCTLQLPNESLPFHVVNDSNGNAFVTLKGTSKLLKLKLHQNQIETIFDISIGNTPLGVAVDSKDNVFVASASNYTVYKLDNNGNILRKITNGIFGPWSCTIDSNDELWVANFDANPTTNVYGMPHYTNEGILISPSSGYTLPSGGNQVLLNNGVPLDGVGSTPFYSPLMRQTAIKFDCAGNAWVTNNWKPIAPITTQLTDNPGGDGIVIFVGLGKG